MHTLKASHPLFGAEMNGTLMLIEYYKAMNFIDSEELGEGEILLLSVSRQLSSKHRHDAALLKLSDTIVLVLPMVDVLSR